MRTFVPYFNISITDECLKVSFGARARLSEKLLLLLIIITRPRCKPSQPSLLPLPKHQVHTKTLSATPPRQSCQSCPGVGQPWPTTLAYPRAVTNPTCCYHPQLLLKLKLKLAVGSSCAKSCCRCGADLSRRSLPKYLFDCSCLLCYRLLQLMLTPLVCSSHLLHHLHGCCRCR